MKISAFAWIKTACAVLAAVSICGCGESPEPDKREKEPARKIRRIKDAEPRKARAGKKAKKKKLSKKERRALREARRKEFARRRAEALRAVDESLPPEERKIAIGLRDGLENENLASVAKFSLMARESGNVDIRSQAVDALNWFGVRAISNLTPFLADPDEGVASDARFAWEAGLSEIEDDDIKRSFLETAMSMISDREMLDSIAMNFNEMEDQGAAVESLVKIIDEGDEAGKAAAQEAYEFITGESWSDRATALKWASENRPEPESEE